MAADVCSGARIIVAWLLRFFGKHEKGTVADQIEVMVRTNELKAIN